MKSPKRAGWEGVSVEKIDDKTIKFTLKKPYAPFLENTTIGILPSHIWGRNVFRPNRLQRDEHETNRIRTL